MVDKQEQPSVDWIPLGAAPLLIQADVLEDELFDLDSEPGLLPRNEIECFVREHLTGALIGRVDIDFKSGNVDLLVAPEVGPRDHSDGYDPYTTHISKIGEWHPHDAISITEGDLADFFAGAHLIWPLLLSRFRAALVSGEWSVAGRVGSPLASKFTEINVQDFLGSHIVDWVNGIAIHPTGERVFSIFLLKVLKPQLPQEMSQEEKRKAILEKLRAELKATKARKITQVFWNALKGEFPLTVEVNFAAAL